MAILVNWFEVKFDRKGFELPYVDCSSWEEAIAMAKTYPAAEIVRTRTVGSEIRSCFISGTPQPASGTVVFSSPGPRSILARIIEFNLAQHFIRQQSQVTSGRWGVDVLRPVQEFTDIGLVIKQGANIKFFAATEPQFRSGVTLNWIVRSIFEKPLAALPTQNRYEGYPVILRWPLSAGACPESLSPFNGHYLGTVVARLSSSDFTVLVRDRSRQTVSGSALFPEARTDVISELESVVTRHSGQQSIQRRILQLSHSLKPDGRRNPGILRDQLKSALKTIDPSGRGEVKIAMVPNCSGTMWINCAATGAQRA